MMTIALAWLRRRLAGIIGWVIGLGLAGFALVALYHPYQDDTIVHQTVAALPDRVVDVLGLRDLSAADGFVRASVFGVVGIVMCLVVGIAYGAAGIASDERDGFLEPEVSRAVSRTQVYGARLVAVAVVIVLLGASLTGAAALAVSVLDVPTPMGAMVGWGLAMTTIGAVHGLLCFAVGASTGRPGLARLVASLAAVAGYLAHAFQEHDHGRWVFSLLLSPADPTGLGALWAGLGVAGAVVVLGWLVFRSRDIRTPGTS